MSYKEISHHTYDNVEQLECILEQLQEEPKFKEAYTYVNNQYLMFKQDRRRDRKTPFPNELLLINLDSTIACALPDDDQSDLYSTSVSSSITDYDQPVVHAMNAEVHNP